ncbi:hypothetical protein JIG36_35495 [Actinoplanes sp. LDG1-06]|uniref:Uncharacterized protein n=1 Tax=Paractinoplanes ovalisporus TaxID=2810368 RepID=A0ABS2ALU1_9ACTN|nr:hypothetical protein [Actinoplanes ovalisporus]MBM2620818.1 hypothetical protein [Actinoplanes ovalisporus]
MIRTETRPGQLLITVSTNADISDRSGDDWVRRTVDVTDVVDEVLRFLCEVRGTR